MAYERHMQKTAYLAVAAALLTLFYSVPRVHSLPSHGIRLSQTISQPAVSQAYRAAPQTSSPFPCVPDCGQSGTGALSKTRLRGTALYSFQGSGNTWTRHLLTTASGILTGVSYNGQDEVAPRGAESRRVIAVKTHRNPEDSRKSFTVDRTMTIVRNPYETFLAHFNFMGNYSSEDPHYKKTAVRPIEDFYTAWPKASCSRCNAWQNTYMEWAKDRAPLYVIVYNRLVTNLEQELHNIFNFLNESSIVPRIDCALKDSEGVAHRQKPEWLEKVAVFPDDCKVRVNNAIDAVQKALEAKTGQNLEDFQQWKK